MDAFNEMIDVSLEKKRGITFFMQGQAVAGYVTKKLEGAVEARSQEFDRIVIRLDRVDGMAMN